MVRKAIRNAAAVSALIFVLTSCGGKKYDTPIGKDTQQPDKILFDKAIDDIEHSRFEVARLTLQTLINTYDTSEYLAKAKLAVADSWLRQGGALGLAQAEAEYKDFILFYPTMEEAAEAQEKICNIHYRQLEKADRDPTHSVRAEEECRTVVQQFPGSKFTPTASQYLRNVQENLADGEFRVGKFYQTKGSFFAAANRLQTLVDEYPLFSKNDEALWSTADSYAALGDYWEKHQAAALTKLVREYPLSPRVEAAKLRLQAMNIPIPEADPVAYARMKFELENREEIGLWSKFWGAFSMHPNLKMAAKSGQPPMDGFRPSIPASVPKEAAGTAGTSGDITVSVPADASALDTQPDARSAPRGEAPAPDPGAQPARNQ